MYMTARRLNLNKTISATSQYQTFKVRYCIVRKNTIEIRMSRQYYEQHRKNIQIIGNWRLLNALEKLYVGR